jgi:hypothetical protein
LLGAALMRPARTLLFSVLLGAAGSCASGGDGPADDNGASPGVDADGGGEASPGAPIQHLTIAPADPVIEVTSDKPPPTVAFHALADGREVNATWDVDRGEIGVIAAAGVFTPRGTIGGVARVHARVGSATAETSVTVHVHWIQNGAVGGDAGAGAGGSGGVGGEGPGGPVSDDTGQTLMGPPVADPSLSWLYPYDRTVWPRGILAPLLQWTTARPLDAVYIHVTEASFEYQGFFQRPAAPFVHHPIPQDVWRGLTASNAGEDVTVSLVFASGKTAYGPITEKWKVAPGSLKGTVYYNSYGTNLATSGLTSITGADIGAATLAIRGGSTDPTLVTSANECRVCHSVSADGSRLVTSGPETIDLKSGQPTTIPSDGRMLWSALYPDGTFLFSNSAPQQEGNYTVPSALYGIPSGAVVPSTGLPAGLQAACPSFSPDGKRVVYNVFGGPDSDQKSLGMMDFDAPSKTFSNARLMYTPPSGVAVWPAFIPTVAKGEFSVQGGVVFELEVESNGHFAETRSGCDAMQPCPASRGELWWLDVDTKIAHRLDRANGVGALPAGPNGHDDDATLNYEPTVNPVASGGYAWVVFTSRRMYGNVATVDPFYSDPRFHDISRTPTTKKLWVAAIDLDAPPGSDPSHPAFYVPAQELMAGNTRGYWVLDPCSPDAADCATGDECCGGYCHPGPDGKGTCSDQPSGCALEFDKCAANADCCTPGLICVNGRCAQAPPR